jgi:hypothetical protein
MSLPLPPEGVGVEDATASSMGGGASEIMVERGMLLADTGGGAADCLTPGTLRAGSGIDTDGWVVAATAGAGGGEALVSGVTSSATVSMPESAEESAPATAPETETADAGGAGAAGGVAGTSTVVGGATADAGADGSAGTSAAVTSPELSAANSGGARPI